MLILSIIALAALLAAQAILHYRLRARVLLLEDFDELEMCAREMLGSQVKRINARLGRDWEAEAEDDDDDDGGYDRC